MTAGVGAIPLGRLASFDGEFVSEWVTVAQERISRFAEATEDRQWIHVDSERARRESPYGDTVAHGFLTLSLIGHLLREAVPVSGAGMRVNYGLNRVRFTAPLLAGSRIRGRFRVLATERTKDALKVTWNVVVEGEAKAVCVAEWIVLYYTPEPSPPLGGGEGGRRPDEGANT